MSDTDEERNRRVAEYVRGRADDETARQTEIDMLEDDDLFERVQTEDLIKRGFAEHDRTASSGERDRKRKTTPLPRLGWALAASFAAVAVALGIYSQQLSERIETLESPSVGLPVITLFEQRSLLPEPKDPMSNLAGQEGPVLLEIDVSGYEHDSYQLEVLQEDGSLIWESQAPDKRGYLTVMITKADTLKAITLRSPSGKVLKSYVLLEE